jgi:hypothetical protein
VRPQHCGLFGSNEDFWVDLAQHLGRIWRDIQAIPTDHPNQRVEVILQYTERVTDAVRTWEEIDPCSPMIPEALLAELTAGAEALQLCGAGDNTGSG